MLLCQHWTVTCQTIPSAFCYLCSKVALILCFSSGGEPGDEAIGKLRWCLLRCLIKLGGQGEYSVLLRNGNRLLESR